MSALDFDIFLNTSLTFESFYDFILNYSPFNQVYLEVYALCGILERGIQEFSDDDSTDILKSSLSKTLVKRV